MLQEALLRRLATREGRPRRVKAIMRGRVTVVITRGETGETETIEATNVVSNAGDLYYAEMMAGETPTNDFGAVDSLIGLGTAGDAPSKTSTYANITTKVSGGEAAFTTAYPKTDDQDAANTGKGSSVVTYKATWAAGVATSNGIDRVYIALDGATGTDPLLMYAVLNSFNKGASDTLTLYVNHTPTGV